jgi:hypothetical protein
MHDPKPVHTLAITGLTHGPHVSRVSLHASDADRPFYESMAFAQTNEMRRDDLV